MVALINKIMQYHIQELKRKLFLFFKNLIPFLYIYYRAQE